MGRTLEFIRELIEKELEEMTTTGDVGGFGTPYAFQGNKEANRRKRRQSAAASGYKVVQNDEANRSFSLDEKFERVVAGAINEADSLEKDLKIQSNFPGKGEASSYKMPDGSIAWAARNKKGVLKKFHSKKNALKFRNTINEAKIDIRTLSSGIVGRPGIQTYSYGNRRAVIIPTDKGDTHIVRLSTGGARGKSQPDKKVRSRDEAKKMARKWVEGAKQVNEATTMPEWEYVDNRGVKHRGHVKHVSDRGGTDVTYQFVDMNTGELSLLNGPRVKAQAKTTGKASKPHKEIWPRHSPRRNEESVNENIVKHSVTEAGDPYYSWRNDESMTPKQKIGKAISEINKQLVEMHKVVKRSSRLKKEMGMSANDYWKRTNNAFLKMEQRMHRISQKIREMRV